MYLLLSDFRNIDIFVLMLHHRQLFQTSYMQWENNGFRNNNSVESKYLNLLTRKC